ncbi:MAG: SAM hydroxide adenosyltransferase, partial [Solirubrobacterales bacterium]
GDELAALGEPVDLGGLQTLERQAPLIEPGRRIAASVAYVDRFGNAALELTEEQALDTGLKLGHRVWVEAGGLTLDAVYAVTFGDVPSDQLLLYRDSYGNLALAVNRGSAIDRLGISAADRVVLRPA